MAKQQGTGGPPGGGIMPLGDEDVPPSYRLGGIAFFGYRLAVTAKLFDRKFVEVLKAHSTLTLPQWRCLAQLGLSQPGTVRSLAEGAVVDRAEVSRALARLSAQGIVQRHDNEGDQRSPHFSLTPKGRALYDHLRKPVSEFIGSLVARVDEGDIEAADRVLWTLSRGCND